ncbi:hypothetical protein IL992_21970 [Microbispora sp. NEAU-D428]|nr:hypothetical protein [Microbispora sitophila]
MHGAPILRRVWAGAASAHGSVVDPASRNYGCWLRWGSDFQNPATQPLERGDGKAHECDDGGTERLRREGAARDPKADAAEREERERDDPQPGKNGRPGDPPDDPPEPRHRPEQRLADQREPA